MIPQAYITEWRSKAPWQDDFQVEQDCACRFCGIAESWKYSSAVDYYTNDRKGLLEIVSVY